MTGGEAYRAKLITDDGLDAAISANLSAPAVLKINKGRSRHRRRCPGAPVVS